MTTNDKLPELKGLVLAGGRSTRMGQDKGTIRYRTAPHRKYLYGLPEPLCAIWEPAGLQRAEQQLSEQQITCPRKFLIRTQVPLLTPAQGQALYNANRPEDYEHSLRQLAPES